MGKTALWFPPADFSLSTPPSARTGMELRRCTQRVSYCMVSRSMPSSWLSGNINPCTRRNHPKACWIWVISHQIHSCQLWTWWAGCCHPSACHSWGCLWGCWMRWADYFYGHSFSPTQCCFDLQTALPMLQGFSSCSVLWYTGKCGLLHHWYG